MNKEIIKKGLENNFYKSLGRFSRIFPATIIKPQQFDFNFLHFLWNYFYLNECFLEDSIIWLYLQEYINE